MSDSGSPVPDECLPSSLNSEVKGPDTQPSGFILKLFQMVDGADDEIVKVSFVFCETLHRYTTRWWSWWMNLERNLGSLAPLFKLLSVHPLVVRLRPSEALCELRRLAADGLFFETQSR